jgi:hypothetical protein
MMAGRSHDGNGIFQPALSDLEAGVDRTAARELCAKKRLLVEVAGVPNLPGSDQLRVGHL